MRLIGNELFLGVTESVNELNSVEEDVLRMVDEPIQKHIRQELRFFSERLITSKCDRLSS